MQLHVEIIRGIKANPARGAVAFLHGILGAGVNLKCLARKCLDALPELTIVLVDLRAHGKSLEVSGVDEIDHAADDVAETFKALQLEMTGVVGHSFGGKVALALIERVPTLQCVVTLDSAPGTRMDARGSETTSRVLLLLESLNGPWPTRDDFTREVVLRGESRAIAQWLAMNLVRRADGFHWGLELPRIRSLLQSYFEYDAWPAMERVFGGIDSSKSTRLHLVAGSESTVYDDVERKRAESLVQVSGGRVHFVTLQGGHWLHVDNPEGVSEYLIRSIANV